MNEIFRLRCNCSRNNYCNRCLTLTACPRPLDAREQGAACRVPLHCMSGNPEAVFTTAAALPPLVWDISPGGVHAAGYVATSDKAIGGIAVLCTLAGGNDTDRPSYLVNEQLRRGGCRITTAVADHPCLRHDTRFQQLLWLDRGALLCSILFLIKRLPKSNAGRTPLTVMAFLIQTVVLRSLHLAQLANKHLRKRKTVKHELRVPTRNRTAKSPIYRPSGRTTLIGERSRTLLCVAVHTEQNSG